MNKLQLLHGPAVNNSRHKLNSIREKFDADNVVVFDERSETQEIVGSLMTQSIFVGEKLFILENPSEDLNLPLITSDLVLVIWFDHTVTEKKPIMDWAKKLKAEILFFPEDREVSVFPFLDYLANEDQKAFLEIKKLKNGGFDIFYFLTMTFYLLRNLVNTPKKAPQFVRQKLDKQRKNFDLQKITKLYEEMLELDFKLKSGLLDQNQAEFLLVNKFID